MARLIVGNWKMNLNPTAGSALMSKLESKLEPSSLVEVVVCPPVIDLVPLAAQIDHTKLKLGVQNIHDLDVGPFTGEISGAMVKGMADYVLVGHSERRAMGEDDKLLAKKVAASFRNGLTPIVCVGENLHDREHKLSIKVVIDQLTADLAMVTASEVKDVVIAYEPVWAIGTGKFATPDEIVPVVRAIRETVEELYGEAGGVGVRLLYGGSVSRDNAAAYLAVDGIDGLLIGGASLVADDFCAIVEFANRPLDD